MTKNQQVIDLLNEGKSVAEISRKVDMLYPNVARIKREWLLKKNNKQKKK